MPEQLDLIPLRLTVYRSPLFGDDRIFGLSTFGSIVGKTCRFFSLDYGIPFAEALAAANEFAEANGLRMVIHDPENALKASV